MIFVQSYLVDGKQNFSLNFHSNIGIRLELGKQNMSKEKEGLKKKSSVFCCLHCRRLTFPLNRKMSPERVKIGLSMCGNPKTVCNG